MRNKSIISGCVFISALTTMWVWITCTQVSLCQTASAPSSMAATTQAATQSGKYRDVDKFGKKIGETIENGFVFINGKYIEPPYTISQIGADVFINDILTNKNPFWPLPKYDLTKDSQGVPPGITDDMDYGEMLEVLGEHHEQHLRYISANPSDKPFIERLADYYRQMPCVAKVEIDNGTDMVVHMKNKSKQHIMAQPYEIGMPGYIMTEKHILSYAVGTRAAYDEYLRNNYSLFIMTTNDASEQMLDGKKTAEQLPLTLDILRSNKTAAEKGDLLARMNFFPDLSYVLSGRKLLDQELWFINNFAGDGEKLDKRLQGLAKQLGVKPMTYEDIPTIEALEKKYASFIEKHKKRKLRAASRPAVRVSTTTIPAKVTENK